jgi:hypothetical protein
LDPQDHYLPTCLRDSFPRRWCRPRRVVSLTLSLSLAARFLPCTGGGRHRRRGDERGGGGWSHGRHQRGRQGGSAWHAAAAASAAASAAAAAAAAAAPAPAPAAATSAASGRWPAGSRRTGTDSDCGFMDTNGKPLDSQTLRSRDTIVGLLGRFVWCRPLPVPVSSRLGRPNFLRLALRQCRSKPAAQLLLIIPGWHQNLASQLSAEPRHTMHSDELTVLYSNGPEDKVN